MLGPWKVVVVTIVLGLFAVLPASAVPITMTPGSVSFPGFDFTLHFDGGDTFDNVLNFTVLGQSSSCGVPCASSAVGAMIFDGVGAIAAGDTESGLTNPNNIIRGLRTPGGSLVALLIDLGSPNQESFWAELGGTPTSATVYVLPLNTLDDIDEIEDIVNLAADSEIAAFSAVPEPSSAILLVTSFLMLPGILRRHRR